MILFTAIPLFNSLCHGMQKRGAEIYAEFLGGSFSCDAYHMTEPHPQGKNLRSSSWKVFYLRMKLR